MISSTKQPLIGSGEEERVVVGLVDTGNEKIKVEKEGSDACIEQLSTCQQIYLATCRSSNCTGTLQAGLYDETLHAAHNLF